MLHPTGLQAGQHNELNVFMAKDAYKSKTVPRYVSGFRQYYRYCIEFKYNPWLYEGRKIKYWCSYLLYRVRKYSISVLINSRRGITYVFMDLFHYPYNVFVGEYYADFIRKLNKTYAGIPDNRIPILLNHHIMLAKHYNVSTKNAWKVPFNDLLIVLLDQLYGFCGRRGGEYISNTDPLLIDQLSFHDGIVFEQQYHSWKYGKILHKKFKNMVNKQDLMFSHFGDSSHEYINPYHYMYVYYHRRKYSSSSLISNLNGNGPLFVFENGKLFKYADLIKYIVNIYKHQLEDEYLKGRICVYSLRIGCNVMMSERMYNKGQIKAYIGWLINAKDDDSQNRYSRHIPIYWLIGVVKGIIQREIKIGGLSIKDTLGKK